MRLILTFILKFGVLLGFALPILGDAFYRKRRSKKRASIKNIASKYDKKIIYFDRNVIDATSDAGARTIFEVMSFLKEKKLDTQAVLFFFWTTNSVPHSLGQEFQDTKVFTFNQIKILREELCLADYILVKTPENFFLLLLVLLFCKKRPAIWYYGGDIYFERFKSLLKNSSGLAYFQYFVQYLLYFSYESLLWPVAEACLSPNEEEANIIRSQNAHSLVLPIRVFTDLDVKPVSEDNGLVSSGDVNVIFVGGAGHAPNVSALHHAVTSTLPMINERCSKNFILNIVGSGWSNPSFSDWLGKAPNCVMHGRISDDILYSLYKQSIFALALIQDGAGVKGKVIEAMYMGVVVIATPIGAQGIPSEVLPRFCSDSDIADYVENILLDNSFLTKTILRYKKFLSEHYSTEVYKELFDSLLDESS